METFLFCEDPGSCGHYWSDIHNVEDSRFAEPDAQSLDALLSILTLYTMSSPSNEYDSMSDHSEFLFIPFLSERTAYCMTLSDFPVVFKDKLRNRSKR